MKRGQQTNLVEVNVAKMLMRWAIWKGRGQGERMAFVNVGRVVLVDIDLREVFIVKHHLEGFLFYLGIFN